MSYTEWLRRQVERLEEEIRQHDVFASDAPASAGILRELRTKAVIHRYLKQQLLRRVPPTGEEVREYDTREFILVRR